MSDINVGHLAWQQPPCTPPIEGEVTAPEAPPTPVSETSIKVRRVTFYNPNPDIVMLGGDTIQPAGIPAGTAVAPGEYSVVAPDNQWIDLADLRVTHTGSGDVDVEYLAIQ